MGLVENLWTGLLVVGHEGTTIGKLIRPKRLPFLGDFCRFYLDQLKVRAGDFARDGRRILIHQNHLRPECRHHLGSLHGVSLRHDSHERITAGSADDGQTGSSVAAGQFYDGLPGRKFTCLFGIVHYLEGNAVFLRKTRIEVLQLGENSSFARFRQPLEFQ